MYNYSSVIFLNLAHSIMLCIMIIRYPGLRSILLTLQCLDETMFCVFLSLGSSKIKEFQNKPPKIIEEQLKIIEEQPN